MNIMLFTSGGAVIPRQQPNMTTTASRKNSFELLIAVGKKIFLKFASKSMIRFRKLEDVQNLCLAD